MVCLLIFFWFILGDRFSISNYRAFKKLQNNTRTSSLGAILSEM